MNIVKNVNKDFGIKYLLILFISTLYIYLIFL